jgi:uncharacterized membrane protein
MFALLIIAAIAAGVNLIFWCISFFVIAKAITVSIFLGMAILVIGLISIFLLARKTRLIEKMSVLVDATNRNAAAS